jgi:hypothetical protein
LLARVLESLQAKASFKGGFFRSVSEVIVVASCSRSGSTLFTELLKSSPKFYHFQGEINPFLRLAGLAWPDSQTGSDALGQEHALNQGISVLETLLASEAGCPSGQESDLARAKEDFSAQLYRRLCLQWPLEHFTCGEVCSAAEWALSKIERVLERKCDWQTDLSHFHALFLSRLKQEHPVIDINYYDLDRSFLPVLPEEGPRPSGPPCPLVIEEPPFILVQPWVQWRAEELPSRALLIKTPSNAYRLPFLQALFPFSRFRILHLTRNPAASINGMLDGWRHRGFHSHYVGDDLQIQDFSHSENLDSGWWKFDLPPGWRTASKTTLEQVCAFQWRSAQQSILEFARETGVDYLQVRFEDIANSLTAHGSMPFMVREWLGCGELLGETTRFALPVMATQAPRPGRWRERATMLNDVLQTDSIRQLCRDLGYEDQREWI